MSLYLTIGNNIDNSLVTTWVNKKALCNITDCSTEEEGGGFVNKAERDRALHQSMQD